MCCCYFVLFIYLFVYLFIYSFSYLFIYLLSSAQQKPYIRMRQKGSRCDEQTESDYKVAKDAD